MKQAKQKTKAAPAADAPPESVPELVPPAEEAMAEASGPADEVDPEAPAAPEKTEEALARVEAEKAKIADQLLRLQADFDNFRRRTARERADVVRRASEEMMTDLLPILDHFSMGLDNAVAHDANDSVVEGFRLVLDQLHAMLKKFGLEPVDAVGELFDPNHHEAITQMPSAEVPEDHVVEQTRRGFRLGERLLRPAQVVVSSGAPAAPGAETLAEESAPAEPAADAAADGESE